MIRRPIRSFIGVAVAAATLVGGLVFAAAGPASAAPASTDVSSSAAAVVYRYHSTWPVESSCRARGAQGSTQGVWTTYYCSVNSRDDWELWVDDRCRICLTPALPVPGRRPSAP